MIDLVSTLEISQRLGVEKNTVHQWRYRGLFPEPDWQLSIGPVWKWATVARWAAKTGRQTE
jgi:hypothetical protein